MEKNNELKKTSIKLVKLALSRYYCFDDIIKIEDFDFDNILSDEKWYKNILIYDVLYKTLVTTKPWCVMFDTLDEFIRD